MSAGNVSDFREALARERRNLCPQRICRERIQNHQLEGSDRKNIEEPALPMFMNLIAFGRSPDRFARFGDLE